MLAELLRVPIEVRHRGARGGAGARWVAVGPGSGSASVPDRGVVAEGAGARPGETATARPSHPLVRR
jgi:hypothetical protein